MSYCRQEGKDRVIFVTKEDHEAPSNAELIADDPNDPYEDHGLILPSGEINWNCPCLGGMASGPCGEQFKSAFSCFHYSTEEVKGSDCVDKFRSMQECMQRYPELYPQEDESAPQGGDETPSTDPLAHIQDSDQGSASAPEAVLASEDMSSTDHSATS
ncbi:mitochondrial intermembrane space import and assembly protein 40-like [Scleropages formosus]|uniref:Coiled-coil-helix-coiled-coil-helix domain containing 4a n=1 Tax=Scleropages formosus TaxID=113540 RepID=A0A0P7XAR0_SCLFO|nr:mitochondrial intermembrane space import and assembly protein 40 [Scleropages formosus]KPP73479.1 mitochondrial intermembrane space import and assembly protein 40-like [Scleropages formosus]